MITDLHEFFEQEEIQDEFLKFERIENPRSKRPDLHAFLLLDELQPGERDIVSAISSYEIWLNIDVDKLLKKATPEQLIALHRCGVRYDENADSLCMFV